MSCAPRLTGSFCVVHPDPGTVSLVNETYSKAFEARFSSPTVPALAPNACQANINDNITVTWGVHGGIREALGPHSCNRQFF